MGQLEEMGCEFRSPWALWALQLHREWGKNVSVPEFMNFEHFLGLDHFSGKKNAW